MKKNKMAEAIDILEEKYVMEAAEYTPKKKTMRPAMMSFMAMAACLALILGIGLVRNRQTNPVQEEAEAIVSIDVNPSIELTVNKQDKVTSATALNEDAKVVLSDMNLKNVDLSVALNAIMGALLKNGYLDEVYNAVNICVEENDAERATELGEKVSSEISSIFDKNDLIGGVNTQLLSKDDEIKKLADSYGISVGKLNLAQQVVESAGVTLDVAVTFSIAELWDLLKAEDVVLITREEALQIALTDAGVTMSQLTVAGQKIQESAGVYTYIVNFIVNGKLQYEYKINAVTGTIITCEFSYKVVEKEPVPEPTQPVEPEATPEPTQPVEPEATPDVTPETTPEPTPGTTPEPTPGTMPELTPTSAPQIPPKGTPPVDPKPTKAPKPEPVKPQKEYTKKEALALVYQDAGVQEKDAKLSKLQHMPKEKQYHIEFSVGLCDYVYDISSVDGTVIQKEVIDHTAGGTTDAVWNEEKVLELVLAKAGVVFEDLTKCEIKFHAKKDGKEYTVHFHVDKAHYEYTVDAVTGQITEKAKPGPATPEKPVPPQEKEKEEKETPLLPHEKEAAEKNTPVGPKERENK